MLRSVVPNGSSAPSRARRRAGPSLRHAQRDARMRQFAADHHPCERRARFPPRIARARHATGAQDRRPLAERADLVQLVADVENAATLAGKCAQRLEQSQHCLRRQDRRRLVHDQKPRVLQQAAHDLDALSLADRHRMHVPLGLERKAIAARDVDDPLAQPGGPARRRMRRDVLGDGQRLEQREMLEHHADAKSARMRRDCRSSPARLPRAIVPASGSMTP